MYNVLLKEIRLSASVLSFVFIIFSLMFFLPGYPILCGAFFVTLGIFQSFQKARETNDILFSVLLPIAKRDVVKGKILFVFLIELISLIIMSMAVALRMTILSESEVYRNNALMNGNLFALCVAFCIFGAFNIVFVGGFFKTAYVYGKPFIIYIIVCFLIIAVAETLHHIPGLEFLNAFSMDYFPIQMSTAITGMLMFVAMTIIAYRVSYRRFEKIDL